jgi:hypothetical protein
MVIGGDAYLAIYEHDAKERAAEPVAAIEVPARSLLLALTGAVDDDQRTGSGGPARG